MWHIGERSPFLYPGTNGTSRGQQNGLGRSVDSLAVAEAGQERVKRAMSVDSTLSGLSDDEQLDEYGEVRLAI